MTDSRATADLHPVLQAKCLAHQRACAAAGIPITVTFTYRSMETQARLYAQGRTTPGKRVTNAKAGQSFHNYRLAYDATPTALLKLPNWGDTPEHQAETDRIWALYGKLAKEQGCRWGGDWKFKDRPHVEFSGDLTLKDLQAGKRL